MVENREIPIDLAFKIYTGCSPSLTIRQILGDEVYCAIAKQSRRIKIKLAPALAAMSYCFAITLASLVFTLNIWLEASGIIVFLFLIVMILLLKVEHLSIDKLELEAMAPADKKSAVLNLIKFQQMILSGELKIYKRQIFTRRKSALPKLNDPSFFGDDLGYVWILGRERSGLWSKSFDRPSVISLYAREADILRLMTPVRAADGLNQDLPLTEQISVGQGSPSQPQNFSPVHFAVKVGGRALGEGPLHGSPGQSCSDPNLGKDELADGSASHAPTELQKFSDRVKRNVGELISGDPELIKAYLLQKMESRSEPQKKLARALIAHGHILRDNGLSEKTKKRDFGSKAGYCDETVRQIIKLKSDVLRGMAE